LSQFAYGTQSDYGSQFVFGNCAYRFQLKNHRRRLFISSGSPSALGLKSAGLDDHSIKCNKIGPMVHNTKAGLEVWKWTPKRELAARLIAESGLPDKQIAAQVGVSHRALCNWKYHPEFVSRVDEYLRAYAETVRRKGIAALERRLDSYLEDWDRIQTTLRERGTELADSRMRFPREWTLPSKR
jgi:hypothetical protein